jgi:hypothetical protein
MKLDEILILFGILTILNAFVIAIYARKRFALTFALSFFFSGLAIAGVTAAYMNNDEIFETPLFWAILSGMTISVYIGANPLRYFWAWLLFLGIFINTAIQFEIELGKNIIIAAAVISLVLVIVFRKPIKLILVGTISGYNLAIGIGLIVFSQANSSKLDDYGQIINVLTYALIALGIYFQFALYNKVMAQYGSAIGLSPSDLSVTNEWSVNTVNSASNPDVNETANTSSTQSVGPGNVSPINIKRIGIWLAGIVLSLVITQATTGLEPDDLFEFRSHELMGYPVLIACLAGTYFADKKLNAKK